MYRLNIFLTNLRGKCKYIRSMGHIITMAFCVCWYTTTFPGRLRPQFEESGVEGHNFDGGFMDANAILTNFHAHILLHPWVRDMCGTRAVQWREVCVGGAFRWACSIPCLTPQHYQWPVTTHLLPGPQVKLQVILSWVWLYPCMFPGGSASKSVLDWILCSSSSKPGMGLKTYQLCDLRLGT